MNQETPKISARLLNTAVGSYVGAEFRALARISTIPVLLLAIISYIDSSAIIALAVWPVISEIASTGVIAVLSVNVHRRYLLGEQPRLSLGDREFGFLLALIIFFLPTYALGFLSEALTSIDPALLNILNLLFLVVLLYVFLRVALWFPAIAVESEGTFWGRAARSWNVTKRGKVGPLFWSMVIPTIMVFLLTLVPFVVFGVDSSSFVAQVLLLIYLSVISVAFSIWAVLLVSVAYKHLIQSAQPDINGSG
ncbi:MAG: hypothetical protein HN644_05505 [Rhodospirillales bacterium]|jgi:hypothetical protein|nr:hypothetical protein [Rhodospirillales bacterium]MBT4039684.1 hypothetical protein [Rhodospirillales bacterium]MBT4626462.1 hypothetical protein [Rhodospirillales bacterium]MBT5350855.1 hypothetical protein [Rhodospirillales bacterium]MBT5520705.1 hypothetical protein [Rhodospirillales bacterium]